MGVNTTYADQAWQGILDADESILWQGSPDPSVHLDIAKLGALGFGLAFSGFALFWMIMASQAGGLFWMFGLIHFFAGVAVGFGPIFGTAWVRRHTFYTLTTKRAFIAKDLPIKGRSLKSYPITAGTVIDLDLGPPGSVFFATESKRRENGYDTIQIGFERISDAQDVFRRMRDVQNALTGPSPET